MIISIMGNEGSGKSTIAKMLAEALDYRYYDMGKIRRELAKKKGMTITEFNKYGETNSETDIEVDDYQKELGEKEDNFVVSGRTSWYFIPHSIKLFLKVDKKVGAERVFKELQKSKGRNEDKNLNTLEDVIKSHKNRKKSDKSRYKKYYGINAHDTSNFDIVIDTSELNIEEVLNKSLKEIRKWQENH